MFKDALHEQLGSWALAYIPWDGADHGEVARIAEVVDDGGDDAFHDAWNDAAERLMEEGRAALARGHAVSARACFLRAAGFYAKSVHPLFGEPVDPRLPAAARRQMAAFAHGMALGEEPALALLIPFDPVPLPAWFVPAHGHANARRPLLVFVNGYDGSITDLYFGSAVATARRGYHSLVFDGPGQG